MNIRKRVMGMLAPSIWMRDVLIGGVGLLTIRISYDYLRAFSLRPDLLAQMGPGVILGILGISITGVLISRLVDVVGSGINRMADSVEHSATSAVDSAQAQSKLADSQQVIAQSIQQLAGRDDRSTQQLEVLMGTLIVTNKRVMRRLHSQDRALQRLENKAGIRRPIEEVEAGNAE